MKILLAIIVALSASIATAQDQAWAYMRLASMRPASSAWSPLSIPGCAGWWDGSDESSVQLNGTSVTNWIDKSVNIRNARAEVLSYGPSYTNTQNSLKTVSWNGTNILRFSQMISSTNELTLFTAFSRRTKLQSVVPIAGAERTFPFYWYYFNDKIMVSAYAMRWESAALTNTGQFYMSIVLCCGHVSNNVLRLNGTKRETVQASVNYSGTQLEYLGGREYDRSSGDNTKSDLHEIIVYTNALSTGDVVIVENYLKTKWGI